MGNWKFGRATILAAVLLTLMLTVTGGTYAMLDNQSDAVNTEVVAADNVAVEMFYLDDVGEWKNAENAGIFNCQRWEPGYVQLCQLKIKNVGTLALKYALGLEIKQASMRSEVNLADVIDVYVGVVTDGNPVPAKRSDLTAQTCKGSMTSLDCDEEGLHSGVLPEKGAITLWVALKMQESAGNEYQGLSVGQGFKLVLRAGENGTDGTAP